MTPEIEAVLWRMVAAMYRQEAAFLMRRLADGAEKRDA